jgi:GNAT superfamily N-acetyltransferase
MTIRPAHRDDVGAIVALLADDMLGRARETPNDPVASGYLEAFDAIDVDLRNLLLVGELDGAVVATVQLTFIPSLSRGGSERVQIEAVRVASDRRGQRLGEQLIEWALAEGRRRGCSLAQLSTDKRRTDAHRFYERLGFVATHEGMKLDLASSLRR